MNGLHSREASASNLSEAHFMDDAASSEASAAAAGGGPLQRQALSANGHPGSEQQQGA